MSADVVVEHSVHGRWLPAANESVEQSAATSIPEFFIAEIRDSTNRRVFAGEHFAWCGRKDMGDRQGIAI